MQVRGWRDHTGIYCSEEERVRITEAVQNEVTKKALPTPWKSILTSKPFWGLLLADLTNGLGLGVFFMVSKYLKAVHGFNIKTNGEVNVELLKKLTKPFSKKIVQVNDCNFAF